MVKYVQFSDASETAVVAVFSDPQNPDSHPNQGEIDDNDPRYLAFVDPASTLFGSKATQLAAVAAAFQVVSSASVADSNGLVWNGGESSAMSIYGACQLAQAAGLTAVELYDLSNVGHTMSIAQGMALAAAIGMAYQAAFSKYQALKVQIKQATSIAEVDAIAWG